METTINRVYIRIIIGYIHIYIYIRVIILGVRIGYMLEVINYV